MTQKKTKTPGKQSIIQLSILAVLVLMVIGLGALVAMPGQAAEDTPLLVEGTQEAANAKPDSTVLGGSVPSPTPTMAATPTTPVTSPAPSEIPKSTQTPRPTKTPAPEPTAKPSPTPEPTKKPEKSSGKPLSGKIIGIDPGHQKHANREQEPIAPGSDKTKDKVSSGTYGRFTGVREYEVALQVGLKLRDMLEDLGAQVVMTRTKNDVNLSNIDRAKIFNKADVDLGVRLHCNGSDDADVHGAFMLVPKSKEYPYYDHCVRAAKKILAAYGEATGISVKKGITYRDDQTGFNWCERPTVNIEMGHMTNKEEDYKLTDSAFQKKMAEGIKNGILAYFGD